MHSSFRYQDLFRYRSVWMGVAILWVVLYHSSINLAWITWLKSFGYGGVDIFFFASGLGCYYSLRNNSNPFLFMVRRFKRIFPSYYLVLFFWLIINIFAFQIVFTPVEFLSNLFCTGSFCGADHQFNWYISGVWLSYLLAPFLAPYIDHSTGLQRVFPVVILFLISITFLPFSWNMSLTFTRLPLFYIGMLFAKSAQTKSGITFREITIWLLSLIIGTAFLFFCHINISNHLSDWGLYWYPFILIVPGLCILISLLCIQIERLSHGPITFLSNIGACSFELYLIHITAFDFIEKSRLQPQNNILWYITIIACCLLAVLLRKSLLYFMND